MEDKIKDFTVSEETLEKVKSLRGFPLVASDGQEGTVEYILKINPYGDDNAVGHLATVRTKDDEWVEYSYRGEKGMQMLLDTWHLKEGE